MESAYIRYIDESGILMSPSLEQVRRLALDHLREEKHPSMRPPGGLLVVYDETRRDWSDEAQP
ncbi:MAG: hypothetical protein ACREUX_20275 [Burkholderiales bacterium]